MNAKARSILVLVASIFLFLPFHLWAKQPGRAYNKSWLWVDVSDTGIGIKLEDQARIFREFEQVDSSYARQQKGTGLGLALSRRLAELHGGHLQVESEGTDRGSTFSLTLPAEPGTPETKQRRS